MTSPGYFWEPDRKDSGTRRPEFDRIPGVVTGSTRQEDKEEYDQFEKALQKALSRQMRGWREKNVFGNEFIGRLFISATGDDRFFTHLRDYNWPKYLSMGEPYVLIIPQAENVSTTDRGEPKSVEVGEQLTRIFKDHAEEEFEIGYESEFERQIQLLVNLCPEETLELLEGRLENDARGYDLISEAIRAVGRLKDSRTRTASFPLLINALEHTSPEVRDSAALALYDSQNKKAIAPLKRAADREQSPLLKREFLEIARRLGELEN